jgi:hypothetical protein
VLRPTVANCEMQISSRKVEAEKVHARYLIGRTCLGLGRSFLIVFH